MAFSNHAIEKSRANLEKRAILGRFVKYTIPLGSKKLTPRPKNYVKWSWLTKFEQKNGSEKKN